MMTGFGMGFGGIGAIGMILFWVAVIAGIVWLVRTMGGSNTQFPPQMQSETNARNILDQRYARGEINRDEYEAMKQDLQ
ncbi:MAG TPA: SHOCT domain-containing protein [Anaerolineales bacterium]|nr:SHOCT domain-containing protein [Anaerolineales bacterium]